MHIAKPVFPTTLLPLSDLVAALQNEDTISGVTISYSAADSLKATSFSLADSKLDHTSLSGVRFERNDMLDCLLSKCDLTAAKFDTASWRRVEITDSRASGIQLQESQFKDVLFESCKLNLANFRMCRLKNVLFKGCDLSEADFYGATMDAVNFERCNLEKMSIAHTTLHKVDMRTSDIIVIRGVTELSGATISSEQLLQIAHTLAAGYKITVSDD